MNPDNDKFEQMSLHEAAKLGDLDAVKFLLTPRQDAQGRDLPIADINAKTSLGKTALYAAAEMGHLDVVTFLLTPRQDAQGHDLPIVDINAKNSDGETALHAAAEMGRFDVVKFLLTPRQDAQGRDLPIADINAKTSFGKTALHEAAYKGDLDVVKFLLTPRQDAQDHDLPIADINAKTRFGRTALHAAAYKGDLAVVKFLLTPRRDAQGCDLPIVDINAKNSDGETALYAAVYKGDLDVVTFLLTPRQDAQGRDLPIADINAENSDGETALYAAAYKGDLAVVKFLLTPRQDAQDHDLPIADINAKTRFGETALYAAVYKGDLAVVKFLLTPRQDAQDHDLPIADINAKNSDGVTALYEAAYNGDLAVVKFLLTPRQDAQDHDLPIADINAKTSLGKTALHEAAYRGDLAVVKFLLTPRQDAQDHDLPIVDINAKNSDGGTALHAAAEMGNLDVVKFLLTPRQDAQGRDLPIADINAKTSFGRTALHAAAYMGHLDVVKFLVNPIDAQGHSLPITKADVNILANDKCPIEIAFEHGYPDIARYLLNVPGIVISESFSARWNAYIAKQASTRSVVLNQERQGTHDVHVGTSISLLTLFAKYFPVEMLNSQAVTKWQAQMCEELQGWAQNIAKEDKGFLDTEPFLGIDPSEAQAKGITMSASAITSFKREKAALAVTRLLLTASVDSRSGLSIQFAMCVLWHVLKHTKEHSMTTNEDVAYEIDRLLVRAFHKAQREYLITNSDDHEILDNKDKLDQEGCTPGTFNAIVQTLQTAGSPYAHLVYGMADLMKVALVKYLDNNGLDKLAEPDESRALLKQWNDLMIGHVEQNRTQSQRSYPTYVDLFWNGRIPSEDKTALITEVANGVDPHYFPDDLLGQEELRKALEKHPDGKLLMERFNRILQEIESIKKKLCEQAAKITDASLEYLQVDPTTTLYRAIEEKLKGPILDRFAKVLGESGLKAGESHPTQEESPEKERTEPVVFSGPPKTLASGKSCQPPAPDASQNNDTRNPGR